MNPAKLLSYLSADPPTASENRPTARTKALVRPATGRRLSCLAGREVGRDYPLDRTPVAIGREHDAAVQVVGDDVSRKHARIVSADDGGLVLEDLGSTNGTLVNGERITRHRLQA